MTQQIKDTLIWPADRAACYGVMCSVHASCLRYSACEKNTNQQQAWIGHCGPTHPLYIAVIPVVEAKG